MFGHKTRGGNRGGADRFNWDDVKNDEHRENYLGHSLHGQIGRWTTTARGSDLTWWSEGRSQLNRLEKGEAEEAKRKELEMVKAAEEDAMREAMGLAPKNRAKQIQLDKHEIKALFARNATERDEVQESESAWDHSIRKGLVDGESAEQLEGTGVGSDAEEEGGETTHGNAAATDDARGEAGESSRARSSDSEGEPDHGPRKSSKSKKEKKKHKKKHKKHKKKHKRSRHDSSSSDDGGRRYKQIKLNARGGARQGDISMDARALGL